MQAYSAYDANDRLGSTGTGKVRASFDANGNTLQVDLDADNAWDFSSPDRYDFENRLIEAKRVSGIVQIVYDGDGNRVKKVVKQGTISTTTLYLVDNLNPTRYSQVLEKRTALTGAPDVNYVYGLDLVSQTSAGTSYYYGYDGAGTVRYLTEGSSGLVTDTYSYDAFGNSIGGSGVTPNDYRFSGEQWDELLQMYYLRARYYSPQIGRFWTMDKYEGCCGNPPTLQKYTYAGNDPVNKSDPSGYDFGTLSSPGNVTFTTSIPISKMTFMHKSGPDITAFINSEIVRIRNYFAVAPPIPGPLPGSTEGQEALSSYNASLLLLWFRSFAPKLNYDTQMKEVLLIATTLCGKTVTTDVPGNVLFGFSARAAGIDDIVRNTGSHLNEVNDGDEEWPFDEDTDIFPIGKTLFDSGSNDICTIINQLPKRVFAPYPPSRVIGDLARPEFPDYPNYQ